MKTRLIQNKREVAIALNALQPHIDAVVANLSLPRVLVAYDNTYYFFGLVTALDVPHPNIPLPAGHTFDRPHNLQPIIIADYEGDKFPTPDFFEFYLQEALRKPDTAEVVQSRQSPEIDAIPANDRTLETTLALGTLVEESNDPIGSKLLDINGTKVRVYRSPVVGGITTRIGPGARFMRHLPRQEESS